MIASRGRLEGIGIHGDTLGFRPHSRRTNAQERRRILTLSGNLHERICDGLSRRPFLRIGGLGLGGLSLAELLRRQAQARSPADARGKSVIMVYLGIDTQQTFVDHAGRPRAILDNRDPIRELV